ncbi:neuronal acetylcholine receptor subunit alpha-3-like [Clytia hemisphaerica]|uniref:Uncharacterized protein n=2 Tax=Clytia hemisphaerica TaxID=252671 RepID=A0A7M5V2W0_9CNID
MMKFELLVLLPIVALVNGSETEDRLLKKLFENYNAAARPVRFDKDAVNVVFGLSMSQIVDVHEKSQTLIISAWIRQLWHNQILKWNPDEYNGIREINVDPKTIWRPDIVLYNNADEDKAFGGNLDRMNTRAIISYNGFVKWLAPIILKSQCDIDVRYFPFDTQYCPLKFGSWTYNLARLNFFNESSGADLNKYSENSEWSLVSADCIRNEIKYTCCKEKYPDVTFTIVIARRSLFYLCNLIFPMTVIGMLTILSFLLPAESGERVSLAITLLLAMTVFMLVVAEIIPATSDVVPLVGVFFTASMIEMVIMIVVLCYIMRLYHKGPNDPPMPLWMKKYILNWLSFLVGIRAREKNINKSRSSNLNNTFNSSHRNAFNNNATPNEQMTLLNKYNRNSNEYNKENWKKKALCNLNASKCGDVGYMAPSGRLTEAQLVVSKLDVFIERLRTMDEEDEVKNEWRTVAMTIDRCLLVIFFLVYIVTLLACFLRSPGYVS